VKVEGTGFAAPGVEVDASANGLPHVVVTWSNRNRLTEDTVVLPWTGAAVTPETGQTTTVVVKNATSGAVITTIDGLTGGTYNLLKTAFGSAEVGIVRVTSKRDGYESLQGHELLVRVLPWTADSTYVTADSTHQTADSA